MTHKLKAWGAFGAAVLAVALIGAAYPEVIIMALAVFGFCVFSVLAAALGWVVHAALRDLAEKGRDG